MPLLRIRFRPFLTENLTFSAALNRFKLPSNFRRTFSKFKKSYRTCAKKLSWAAANIQ